MHRGLRRAWLLKNLSVERFKKVPVSAGAARRIAVRQLQERNAELEKEVQQLKAKSGPSLRFWVKPEAFSRFCSRSLSDGGSAAYRGKTITVEKQT